jgi:hypothetical protein
MLYVAFGGGVNSTGMLVGLREHEIKPDLVGFADPGAEKEETYAHCVRVARWLYAWGVPWYWIHKDSMYSNLENECLTRHSLPAIAYGFRSCSDKWKQAPQTKLLNSLKIKPIKAIGFGVDETHRAKPYENAWYPLIEWKWNRNDCIEAIKRAGFPVPVKSSCFFCPAMRKAEIKALAKYSPDMYERALAMERNAELTTIKGLGRAFSWKELAGPEVIEQVCMCFDGEE